MNYKSTIQRRKVNTNINMIVLFKFKFLTQIHIIILFFITHTLASRKPLTGCTRMEIGETRRFEFDSEYYKACALNDAPFFVKKYFVGKGDDPEGQQFEDNSIVYIAVLKEDSVKSEDSPEIVLAGDHIALRTCAKVNSPQSNIMKTREPAKQCGLSTILSFLCYRDKDEDTLIFGEGVGYNFENELQTTNPLAKMAVTKLKSYAEKKCHRIIKVMTSADPSAGGRAYIYAGMDAGYDILMTLKKNNPFRMVSFFKTDELSSRFQEKRPYKEGNKVLDPVLDQFIADHGTKWYLCKKKNNE
jgi:hypothetical protein